MSERDEQTDAVGQRVRTVRKLRGLTQEQLASRAHLSLSLIKKVETGAAPATPYFVTSVARAMQVSVPELHGHVTPRFGTERADVAELETVIMLGLWHDAEGEAYSLDELDARNKDLMVARGNAEYDRMVRELPALLADLRNALGLQVRDDRRRCWRMIAEAHLHAVLCLYRLGSDFVAHAADNGIRAAEQGEDPALACVLATDKLLPLMARGAYDDVRYACHENRLMLDSEPWDTIATRSARGYTHLRSAIVVARTGDLRAADADLDAARRLAEQVPPAARVHGTSFNIDNVATHTVAAAVEAGHGPEALRRRVPLADGLTAGRRASHLIDVSRAYQLVGDRDGTLSTLYAARDAAPQTTRYNPQVHESIRVLARTDRCKTDRLTDLARWAGVAV